LGLPETGGEDNTVTGAVGGFTSDTGAVDDGFNTGADDAGSLTGADVGQVLHTVEYSP